ncbi:uncharacterized protein LOC135834192 [Planococcus citri]|uniref:uncharacterized protein LOC135834192 n=1 Tax=Planococcus citri TaxID=170843 RepID=UPI0031F9F653
MTETVSNVYDLTYPSPINLEKISSMVVAVELWRKEIYTHLESKRVLELDLKKHNIPVRTVLPKLSSTIYSVLEEYVDTFGKSIARWLEYCLIGNVFNDRDSTNILSWFHDFALDWDGTIHEVRTARRMMLCDRLTEDEKFKLACLYCLEDDIKRIWPSVSETKDLNEIDFNTFPQHYYWICYLRNEFRTIPNPPFGYIFCPDDPIDEFMLSSLTGPGCRSENDSSVMYFWNRLPFDKQTPRLNCSPISMHVEVIARYILQKLNKDQLDIFVAERGYNFMRDLLISKSRLVHVLPSWMRIRSSINERNFSHLINEMLRQENTYCARLEYRIVANLFSEIWNSVAQDFKRSVLNFVLYDDELFKFKVLYLPYTSGMKFLITVLQDATFEERNAFWHKNWPKLIYSAPVEDLIVIMKFSFRNENEITSFKENMMSMYEKITERCGWMLKYGYFEALNNYLSFCCLDELKRKEWKVRLLRSNYVGENSVITLQVIVKNKLLNEFIDDAFQGAADHCIEFRNQLTSSPVTQNCLLQCIREGWCFIHLIEFVDTFFTDEQVLVSMKKRFFEYFKEQLVVAGSIQRIDSDDLQVFLVWLLGSEDEVIRYKRSISIEELYRSIMQVQLVELKRLVRSHYNVFARCIPRFPVKVDHFLIWYFNKDEDEIEKLTERFHDEFKAFARRIRRTVPALVQLPTRCKL